MRLEVVPLNPEDPRVSQAMHNEQRLNHHYGLNPSEHHIHLEAHDINVRVCDYGDRDAPPVLIIPGNTGDGFPFVPLIAQLWDRRVLLLNRPGGGLSDGFDHTTTNFRQLAVDTITGVLNHFNIDNVPIIAHSMGGHWSLWFSLDCPARVERLALLGVPGNVLDCRPPLALRLTAVPRLNRRLYAAVLPKNPATSLRGLAFLGHSDERLAQLPPEMGECYYAFQHLPNAEVSTLTLMHTTNTLFGSRSEVHINANELRQIQQPVLMIWGDKDPFGRVSSGQTIATTLPHAVFHSQSRSGHLPWLDDTEQCAELVSGFMRAGSTP